MKRRKLKDEYSFNKKIEHAYLFLAIVGIFCLVAGIVSGHSLKTFPLVIGVAGYVLVRQSRVFSIGKGYFTYKPTPLAGKHIIPTEAVRGVKVTKGLVELKLRNQEKPLRVYLKSFNKEDQKDIILFFRNLIQRRAKRRQVAAVRA